VNIGLHIAAPLIAALVAASPAGAQVLCRSEADDVAALRSFNVAVTRYVELHRRLDARMSPLAICSDVEIVARGVADLADAIRAERTDAAPGDIFGPEIADLVRLRLSKARVVLPLSEDVPAAFAIGESGCVALPAINAAFDWHASAGIGEFERLLPSLPPELEFRFVGRSLVLVDVPAGLVVDVLERALP
jgi:hypothetical protein